MGKLIPARVKRDWSGDFTVVTPGWYQDAEILKVHCIYYQDELQEIVNEISQRIGKPDHGIIIIEVER